MKLKFPSLFVCLKFNIIEGESSSLKVYNYFIWNIIWKNINQRSDQNNDLLKDIFVKKETKNSNQLN